VRCSLPASPGSAIPPATASRPSPGSTACISSHSRRDKVRCDRSAVAGAAAGVHPERTGMPRANSGSKRFCLGNNSDTCARCRSGIHDLHYGLAHLGTWHLFQRDELPVAQCRRGEWIRTTEPPVPNGETTPPFSSEKPGHSPRSIPAAYLSSGCACSASGGGAGAVACRRPSCTAASSNRLGLACM
jgi:hypothetical protein